MYRQQPKLDPMKKPVCGNCGSGKFLYSRGKMECTDCGEILEKPKGKNKHGVRKSERDGLRYDSTHERDTATELHLQLKAGEIVELDEQYRVECWVYRADGAPAFLVRHKVDFRVKYPDGSYKLIEAKGVETDDYKWRRRILEEIWLRDHPDHEYVVIKQQSFGRRKK